MGFFEKQCGLKNNLIFENNSTHRRPHPSSYDSGPMILYAQNAQFFFARDSFLYQVFTEILPKHIGYKLTFKHIHTVQCTYIV